MGVTFNGSTQRTGLVGSCPINTGTDSLPWSISFWFKSSATYGDDAAVMYSVGDASGNAPYQHCLEENAAGGSPDRDVRSSLGDTFNTYSADGSTEVTNDGAWHHVLVTADTTAITVYVDGVAAGITPSPDVDNTRWDRLDLLTLGAFGRNSYSNYFAGSMADFCAWAGIALSADDASTLAGGILANEIESGSIVQYNTLESDGTATVGTNFTDTAAPTYSAGNHPTLTTLPSGSTPKPNPATLDATHALYGDIVECCRSTIRAARIQRKSSARSATTRREVPTASITNTFRRRKAAALIRRWRLRGIRPRCRFRAGRRHQLPGVYVFVRRACRVVDGLAD
jgi:hypothetical protein